MRTRVYKLAGTSTSGNGMASVTVAQPGRITAVDFDAVGVAPAALITSETFELALNSSVSSLTTNDSITSLACFSVGTPVSAGMGCGAKLIAGLSIPVAAGDRLVLNSACLASTGAFATRAVNCHIYVEQA